MLTLLSDQDVTLTFDPSATGLDATLVEYKVIDHEGVEIFARQMLPGWSAGAEAVVVVSSSLNQLAAGLTSVARTVILFVTGLGSAAGTATLQSSYRLVSEDRLPIPQASLLTLAGADMIADDLVSMLGWKGASDAVKTAALLEARQDLNSLAFRYQPLDWQSRVTSDFSLESLEEVSETEYAALEPAFKNALQRAQLLQAEHLLSRTDDDAYREAGVTSITIGESSKTFGNRSVSKVRMSDRSMRVLAKYLAPRRIGRA